MPCSRLTTQMYGTLSCTALEIQQAILGLWCFMKLLYGSLVWEWEWRGMVMLAEYKAWFTHCSLHCLVRVISRSTLRGMCGIDSKVLPVLYKEPRNVHLFNTALNNTLTLIWYKLRNSENSYLYFVSNAPCYTSHFMKWYSIQFTLYRYYFNRTRMKKHYTYSFSLYHQTIIEYKVL